MTTYYIGQLFKKNNCGNLKKRQINWYDNFCHINDDSGTDFADYYVVSKILSNSDFYILFTFLNNQTKKIINSQ